MIDKMKNKQISGNIGTVQGEYSLFIYSLSILIVIVEARKWDRQTEKERHRKTKERQRKKDTEKSEKKIRKKDRGKKSEKERQKREKENERHIKREKRDRE